MIKDITLGQYFPGESIVHRLDPRMKIILTCVYMVVLFTAFNAFALALAGVFMIGVIIVARIPVKMVFKGVKPIIPIIILTTVLNAFYVSGRPIFTLFHFWSQQWKA